MTVLGTEPRIWGTPSLSLLGRAGPPPRGRGETLAWLPAWSRSLVSTALASLWETPSMAWGARTTCGRAAARTGPHTDSGLAEEPWELPATCLFFKGARCPFPSPGGHGGPTDQRLEWGQGLRSLTGR